MADDQLSFAHATFQRFSKTTKRAAFLAEMNRIVPWQRLCAVIEPHYPKAGNGRPPIVLERMLRIFFLQQWFTLSDPAVEEAMYDSSAMREFVGIDLGNQPAPDETTICKFRHLLEKHELGKKIFQFYLRKSESKICPIMKLSYPFAINSLQKLTHALA